MTAAEVRQTVARLARDTDALADDADLHAREDVLYRRVLETIATGACEDPQELACEALKSQTISFFRNYG